MIIKGKIKNNHVTKRVYFTLVDADLRDVATTELSGGDVITTAVANVFGDGSFSVRLSANSLLINGVAYRVSFDNNSGSFYIIVPDGDGEMEIKDATASVKDISTVVTLPTGGTGADGKSAYQVWLDAGNSGTVAAFLASLQGETGQPGAAGNTGSAGADGKSAYQVWLNAGNTGTEAEFLASLQGADGTGFHVDGQDTWANVSAIASPVNGEAYQLTEVTNAPMRADASAAQIGDIVSYDGTSWINLGAIQGAKGDTGAQGPAGADGADAEIPVTVANTDSVNTWQKGQNSLHETIPFSTTLSLDGNIISNSIHIDATGNFTLNLFSNIPSGVIRGGVITVAQDATGGRIATFTGWVVKGNTATTVANTTAIYDYEFILGIGYIKLREVV